MIYATYQLFKEGVPWDKPITKTFKDTAEQNKWELSQMSHPFLTFKLLNAVVPGITSTIV